MTAMWTHGPRKPVRYILFTTIDPDPVPDRDGVPPEDERLWNIKMEFCLSEKEIKVFNIL